MKFQQGHKFAKGGKRPGAGRPTKEQQKIKKAAAEIAREFIETNVQNSLIAIFGSALASLLIPLPFAMPSTRFCPMSKCSMRSHYKSFSKILLEPLPHNYPPRSLPL